MKRKVLVLAGLLMCMSISAFAGSRHSYVVPVNQAGVTDTYALPCTPSALVSTDNTALTVYGVGRSTPLAEAGMIYWLAITPATAGDYVTFRDSNTANSSSTEFLRVEAPTITATTLWQFDPPMSVVNGLSINVSSSTTDVTVCVRQADGDL